MTQHQLGQKDQARSTLAHLREIMKQPQPAAKDASQAFLHEANELLAAEIR